MRFRPCIDLHDGKVKQIVGSSLKDGADNRPTTNFEATQPPAYFADLYYHDGLTGGHVIRLGAGNDQAAAEALAAHPGNMQLGGGITPENAAEWLEIGAAKVIVTSFIFDDGDISLEKLQLLSQAVPAEKLVLDLSCKKASDGLYHVACNRWQTLCKTVVNGETFRRLAEFCSEFLVHAVDVEGKQAGMDQQLIEMLAQDCPCPVTYAGGARSMDDVRSLLTLGQGRVDVTVGSALDIFGGTGIAYSEIVEFDKQQRNR